MTATLWLDSRRDDALSLGGTIQLYQAFQEMALLDGPGFETRWPELFGVPYQVEDGGDADPDWMRDVRTQAGRFLARHGRDLGGYSAGVLKLLAGGGAAVANEDVVGAFLLDDELAPDAEDGRANRPFAAAGADAAPLLPVPTGNQSDSGPTENAAADTAPNLLDIWEDADAWWWPEVVDRLKQKALAFLAGDYYGQPGVVEEGRDRLEGFDDFLLDLGRVIDESLADPDVRDGTLEMLVDAYLDGATLAYWDAGPDGKGSKASARGRAEAQEFVNRLVTNIFCPTGKDGGIDPTCKAGGLGGYRAAAHGPPAPPPASYGATELGYRAGDGVSRTNVPDQVVAAKVVAARDAAVNSFRAAGVNVAGMTDVKIATEDDLRLAGAHATGQGFVYKHHADSDRILEARFADAKAESARGEVPVFATRSMEDVMIHEIAHNIGRRLSNDDHQELERLYQKHGSNADHLPSWYAQENSSEMWAESVLAVVKGYRFGGTGEAMGYGKQDPELENFVRTRLGLAPVGNQHTANARVPDRDVWGQFMSAKAKEMSDRLAAGWRVQAGAVSQGIANIVTRGIAAGKTADEISAEILEFSADVPRARADTIARTEVTRAAAEGQLDAYGRLGVSEISVDRAFELRTQGKNSCPECVALEKLGPMPVEKARGLIPVHPQCKCRWRVVVVPGAVTNELVDAALNIFCPTGKGGGIAPTCKKGEKGGVRSAAYYLDEQGNSAAKPRATAVEIVELDADDDVIHRTHGRLHPTSSQGE